MINNNMVAVKKGGKIQKLFISHAAFFPLKFIDTVSDVSKILSYAITDSPVILLKYLSI